jgi:hypothetical protein
MKYALINKTLCIEKNILNQHMVRGTSRIELGIFLIPNLDYFTGQEGSGSFSDKEFASFLNISWRSVFECANILYIFERRKIIEASERISIYSKLISLSKKITNFRRTLK